MAEEEEKKRENYKEIKSLMDISDKFHRLELDMQSILLYTKNDQQRYEQIFKDQKEIMQKLDRVLTGTDGNDGLVQDVYILKDKEKERSVAINRLWGAIIAIIVGLVTFFISRFFK